MERLNAADISIYVEGKGVVLEEKALMAFDAATGKILAFGAEAENMATEGVNIVAPVQGGKIADHRVAVKLFLCLLHKAGVKGSLFHKPRIAVSVPGFSADVEKKLVEDCLYQAGAGKVILSEKGFEEIISYLRESGDKELKNFQTVIGIVGK